MSTSLSLNIQHNSTFNQTVARATDALHEGALPLLSVQDLASLKATSKAWKEVVESHKPSQEKLDYQSNLKKAKQWAQNMTVYINRGFLSPNERHGSSLPYFSLGTVLNAAKWLREHGNTPIPAHGLGTTQPRQLTPTQYIRGMDDPNEIYGQHYKVLGSPKGVGFQHGEKTFHNEDGLQSTDVQKADACERYVVSKFIKNQPST